MGLTRTGALSLLAASALILSACGGNTNNPSGSSVKVDCGGKKELDGAGATAQQNAIQRFVYVYSHTCPGHALDYNANGSGAGVEQFIKNDTDLDRKSVV